MTRDTLGTIGWSLCIIAAIAPFEWLSPAEKGQPWSKRLANVAYMPFITGFIFLMQPAVNAAAGALVSTGSLLAVLVRPPSDGVWTFLYSLLYAILWDIWQYWVHRAQHICRPLWATHKFHHSERALNVTTHARTHAASHVLFLILYAPVVLLLGSMAPHWIAALIMFRLWGYINHANVRLHLGVLTPLISGPQWHRIHHSVRREHHDRNFATYFPWIDMLFGTYYRPHRNEYPPTGLADKHDVSFLQDATIEPIRVWARMVRRSLSLLSVSSGRDVP